LQKGVVAQKTNKIEKKKGGKMKRYKTENAGQMLLSTEKIDKALMY
jgi:hypothetical protein